MKLKLDENLPAGAGAPLVQHGHDVATVASQGMEGTRDPDLIRACHREQRCLVTLDVEFANPLIYDPSSFPGIALLRLPGRISLTALLEAVSTLARALREREIGGRLWIVQPGRIREYQQD